ncbi:hypothetical protein CEXT_254521 [Caerostris extrusa]|uniref:Uncharacterized protein n=1 Tax=Caerostris extrusa TaxID=172846 RepID=A0AAV4SMV1_CAEEX|nr:hypothetical protein CEXT_254521 [Caerostris extrusa]
MTHLDVNAKSYPPNAVHLKQSHKPKNNSSLVDIVKTLFRPNTSLTLMITNFPLAAVNGGSKSSLASEDPFFIGVWQQYRRQTIFKQCEIPGGLLLVHPSEVLTHKDILGRRKAVSPCMSRVTQEPGLLCDLKLVIFFSFYFFFLRQKVLIMRFFSISNLSWE